MITTTGATAAQPLVAVFDMSVTANSPAGSCMLQIVRGLKDCLSFHVVSDQLDEAVRGSSVHWLRVPLPQRPVLLRFVTYQFLCPIFYRLRHRSSHAALRIATQGEFVSCDICYAHFCHRAYLALRIKSAPLNPLREAARWLTHRFCARKEIKAFRNARIIVVPSKRLAADLRSSYPELSQKTIVVIPNPVDLSSFERPGDFDAIEFRHDLQLEAGDLVLAFVALGDFERKGLPILLESLARVATPSMKLLVIGGRAHEISTYRRFAERYGLSGRVTFVGYRSDVRPYLWSSDIFVFPSLYEIFPLAALQAAAAALPIVTTRVGGVEEFIREGANGWFIDRNPEALTERLTRAVDFRSQLPAIGAKAREAVGRYDASAFHKRWADIIFASL
ncbi:MAG: glycosyltransferase family 4 protein [Bryobacteraceae bacterium]|nr:glycosyltransferase family 4 protein [Bryobacteraceae bacterium]